MNSRLEAENNVPVQIGYHYRFARFSGLITVSSSWGERRFRMFIKIIQATTITLALYALLGLNTLENNASGTPSVEPSKMIVALRQALLDKH